MLSKCLLANPPRGDAPTGVIRSNWFGLEFRSGEMANSWACWPRCLPTLEGSGHALSGPRRKPPQLNPFAAATLLVPVEQWKMANTTVPHIYGPRPALDSEMRAKHPQSDPPLVPTTPRPPPIEVSTEDVVGALRSFPTGSAPGPTCLCANHLKEAVFCPSLNRANNALY